MTRLGSLVSHLVDCEHKTAPVDDQGECFAVGTPAMAGNVISYENARRISRETFLQWTRRLSPKAGDLLLAREAPVGPVVRIPPSENVAPGQRTVLMRPDSRSADPRYLYYALCSPATQARLREKAAGSTVAHLNVADIRSFEFPWAFPGLDEQGATAEVLGALDDKIAANARLASAADALVRAWLDQLRDCGESVLLGDLAANPRRAASPPFEPGHYVGLEHVPRRIMWLAETGEGEGLASGKFVFARDDVLFGKLRPYFHKVVVADRDGICSTDILVLRAKDAALRGYVWAAAASDQVVARVSAMSEGTRMPRTSWSAVASCEVPWPGRAAAEGISSRVVALRDRVSAGIRESDQLAALRDTLLPHLMSGRITVRDAEKAVGEVL